MRDVAAVVPTDRMGGESHLVDDLGQEDGAYDPAGFTGMQGGDVFEEGIFVPVDGGAKDGLDQVGFVVIPAPDVPENRLQVGGQAFDEGKVPEGPVDVGEDRTAVGTVAQVDGAPGPGAVVATPVQDRVRIDHAVARVQFDLDAAGQRLPGILIQAAVLFVRVRSAVAFRYDPEHVVVVEGDVPLEVSGRVVQQVVLKTPKRRLVDGVYVPVPRRRPAVGHRVAHEHETRVARGFRVHDAPADAHGVLVEAESHRIGRIPVHEGFEMQPGLVAGFPLPAGRIVRFSFPGPDLPLAVHHALEAVPQGAEPVGGNHPSKHDESVFDQLTRIEMHVRITIKRCDAGRCPRRRTGLALNLHRPMGMSRAGRQKYRIDQKVVRPAI